MKLIYIIFMTIILILLQGCHPDRFILNYQSRYLIYGTIMGELDSFKQINDNSFRLKSGSVALKNLQLTQGFIHFNYKMIKGDELKINCRTVLSNFSEDNGIIINISSKNTTVSESSIVIKKSDEIKNLLNKENYIYFRNVGDKLYMRHGCDTLLINSKLPSTEYIIITVPDGNEVLISGVEFDKVMRTPIELLNSY